MWIVTIIYWLQLFLCPIIICGVGGYFIAKDISVVALVIGAVAGIVVAEYVRRKIGLSTFFAGIYGSGEIVKKLEEQDKRRPE